jgi:hypothetical protein
MREGLPDATSIEERRRGENLKSENAAKERPPIAFRGGDLG